MSKTTTCLLAFGVAFQFQAVHAQMQKSLFFSPKAELGTYILNENRQVRHTGLIRVYAQELVVKNDKGKDTKYKAGDVYQAWAGPVHYITASGFNTKSGFWSVRQDDKLFVEVVDSGTISLYRHRYIVGGANYSSRELEVYMLHDVSTNSISTLPVSVYTGKGQRFREALAPYVANRPDLLLLLQEGHIDINNLPVLLHALNSGEPYPIKFKEKAKKEKALEDPFADK